MRRGVSTDRAPQPMKRSRSGWVSASFRTGSGRECHSPRSKDASISSTAFRIGFNSKGHDGHFVLFDIEDWAFFLDDIRDRILTPDGRLVLKMIKQDDYAGLKFGDAPLMEYFESRGAVIKPKGRVVWFDPLR